MLMQQLAPDCHHQDLSQETDVHGKEVGGNNGLFAGPRCTVCIVEVQTSAAPCLAAPRTCLPARGQRLPTDVEMRVDGTYACRR